MFADLHLHTNFSDGTYTPEELTAHGQRLGFRALALSDHDTMEGAKEFSRLARAKGYLRGKLAKYEDPNR